MTTSELREYREDMTLLEKFKVIARWTSDYAEKHEGIKYAIEDFYKSLKMKSYICDVCWTSSFEPCDKDFPNAVPDESTGGWMYCLCCRQHETIEKLSQKWTYCKDSVPTKYDKYLVSIVGYNLKPKTITSWRSDYRWEDVMFQDDVYAWMALPEPASPKSE